MEDGVFSHYLPRQKTFPVTQNVSVQNFYIKLSIQSRFNTAFSHVGNPVLLELRELPGPASKL